MSHHEDVLTSLQWLAGTWRGEAGGVSQEEVWLAPAGQRMLGLHRDVLPGKPCFFEYLRIDQTEDGLVYRATPMGFATTDFKLELISENHVRFANPDHDFPQWIEYRRTGDSLTASVGAMVEGVLRETGWKWELLQD